MVRDCLAIGLCFIAILLLYALAVRLLETVIAFVSECVDVAVALFFFVVIVPPLWIWERSRRPMWRTLSKQQTQELQAWLKMTGLHR